MVLCMHDAMLSAALQARDQESDNKTRSVLCWGLITKKNKIWCWGVGKERGLMLVMEIAIMH